MENSCLNKAHQQQRCAETHLRYRRYDEAMECHSRAADLLNETCNLTENPKSLESLTLQRDYHLRQKDLIAMKKEQFENYRRTIESQRHRILNTYCNNFTDSHEDESMSLQVAIYRTMEEADSLLAGLLKKGSGGNSDTESLKSFSTTDTDDRLSIDMIDGSNSNTPVGSKHPKDDSVVIEELRMLNDQLHSLVYKLVNQLDASTREVDKLKEKIKQLESEKSKSITNKNNENSNHLKVATDSSGGTSPFVFSPCSELSPDVHDTRVLPALAPLEMPNFDFSNFLKNNSHPANSGN